MRQVHTGAFMLALCLGAAPAAFAQQATGTTSTAPGASTGGSVLAEVVVTAQRRSESLQRVPISVTAITLHKLAAANITSTADLAAVTPAITFSDVNGNLEPRIRGIGNSTAGASVENSVATYIDGVYLSSANGSLQNLDNIQQVEVLDGPQGTLFGRNATAGLVQILTKDPKSTFGGTAALTYSNYDTSRVDLYLTGPITKNVDADFAFYGSHQGQGWGTDLTTGAPTYKTDRDLAARSKWVAYLAPGTTLHVAFDYSEYSASNPSQTNVNGYQPTKATFTPAMQATIANNPYDEFDNVPVDRKLEDGGVSARLDQDLGSLTLTDIAAYRRNYYHGLYDADGTPNAVSAQEFDWNDAQVTNELQLAPRDHSGPLQWIAGLYYFDLDSNYSPLDSITGGPPAQTNANTYEYFTTQSVAGYGQATYEFLPQTRLTLGFRYTYEDRTRTGDVVTEPPAGASTTKPISAGNITTDTPTWRIALDHNFTDQILGYVSWNRGFKSGGFNPTSPTNAPYQPETLDDYEVGEKATLFDGRLRLNAAFFYYNYSNIQVNAILNGVGVIYNGAKAVDYGADVTFDYALSHDLTLSGGLVGLHDRFTDFPDAVVAEVKPGNVLTTNPVPQSATGNRLPFAPDLTANVSSDYRHPLELGAVDLFVSELYNSGYYTQPDNFLSQTAFHMLNASLSFEPRNSNVTLKVYGKNILNALVTDFKSVSSLGPLVSYEAPVTYGVQVAYRF